MRFNILCLLLSISFSAFSSDDWGYFLEEPQHTKPTPLAKPPINTSTTPSPSLNRNLTKHQIKAYDKNFKQLNDRIESEYESIPPEFKKSIKTKKIDWNKKLPGYEYQDMAFTVKGHGTYQTAVSKLMSKYTKDKWEVDLNRNTVLKDGAVMVQTRWRRKK